MTASCGEIASSLEVHPSLLMRASPDTPHLTCLRVRRTTKLRQAEHHPTPCLQKSTDPSAQTEEHLTREALRSDHEEPGCSQRGCKTSSSDKVDSSFKEGKMLHEELTDGATGPNPRCMKAAGGNSPQHEAPRVSLLSTSQRRSAVNLEQTTASSYARALAATSTFSSALQPCSHLYKLSLPAL